MFVFSELRILLVERDKKRCLYCLTDEDNYGLKMHIDHIIPESVGDSMTP